MPSTSSQLETPALHRKRWASSSAYPGEEDPFPGDQIASRIQDVRRQWLEWKCDWGTESAWPRVFNQRLTAARQGGHVAIGEFFQWSQEHADNGRAILRDLQNMVDALHISTQEEIADLFVQGYQLTMDITSEVKFFEVKVDEFAPAVSRSKVTDINFYYDT